MPHIISTLSADVAYAFYEKTPGMDLPVKTKTILVKGGANVADKRIHTPEGVSTEVTDEELEMLQTNSTFQLHSRNEHIKVLNRKSDIDKAVKNMQPKDKSAPLTMKDYAAPNKPKVFVGADKP